MAFFPFNRKKKQSKGAPKINAVVEKSQLNLELEAVNRKQSEIHDKAEATRKKIENIPKLIEQRKRREQQIIKDRARKSKSLRGLDKQPYKLQAMAPVITRLQHLGIEPLGADINQHDSSRFENVDKIRRDAQQIRMQWAEVGGTEEDIPR